MIIIYKILFTGVPRLRRILCGVAWLYPDIGYCQGMGMIAATILLIMEVWVVQYPRKGYKTTVQAPL